MSSFATVTDRLFAIADAQHMLATIETYWPVMVKFGATPADKKLLTDRLARAIVFNDAEETTQDDAIAEMRPSLDESLGAFRGSASLIVYSQQQLDPTAEAELKVKGKFPESDKAREKFWKGMPKMIKKYTAPLAQRGFSHDDQEKLVRQMGEFTKLMRARKQRKTAHTKSARERDQVFLDLRWSTRCLRRIGRVALRLSPERTKFDRVAYVPKAVNNAVTDEKRAEKKAEKRAALERKRASGKKGAQERKAALEKSQPPAPSQTSVPAPSAGEPPAPANGAAMAAGATLPASGLVAAPMMKS